MPSSTLSPGRAGSPANPVMRVVPMKGGVGNTVGVNWLEVEEHGEQASRLNGRREVRRLGGSHRTRSGGRNGRQCRHTPARRWVVLALWWLAWAVWPACSTRAGCPPLPPEPVPAILSLDAAVGYALR